MRFLGKIKTRVAYARLARLYAATSAATFVAMSLTMLIATSASSTTVTAMHSDSDFVLQFDLNDYGDPTLQPAVQRFNAAKQAADWTKACEAYGEFMKMRLTKRWPDPPLDDFSVAPGDFERILGGAYWFNGQWYQLEQPIDWSDRSHGLEFLSSLHRHDGIARLAYAYHQTHDERFAKEALDELTDWLDWAFTNPLSATSPWNPFWDSLNVSVRMGINWPYLLLYLRDSPYMTGRTMCRIGNAVLSQFEFMYANPSSGGNWGIHQKRGMTFAGLFLAENRHIQDWLTETNRRLSDEIGVDYYPDGSEIELAMSYGLGSLNNIDVIAELLRKNPDLPQLPDGLLARLEKMFDYGLYSLTPDGHMPPVNDGADYPAPWLAPLASSLFPNKQDYHWFATHEGSAPTLTSLAFPFAGNYILRSGWDENQRYMFFDGGLFGTSHQHEDKLSFLVSAFNKDLIIEGGNYFPYGDYPQRRYVESSFAHNTIAIDRFSQNRARYGGGPTWGHPYPYEQPLSNPWIVNDTFDYVAATYGDGYGPDALNIDHRRSIVFLKPQLWLVVDRLLPHDAQSHFYESFLHFDADDLVPNSDLDGFTAIRNADRVNVLVKEWASAALTHTVIKGRNEISPQPTSDQLMQGWAMKESQFVPVPTSVSSWSATGNSELVTLIYPFAGPSAPQITSFIPVFQSDGAVDIDLTIEGLGSFAVNEFYDGTAGSATVSRR